MGGHVPSPTHVREGSAGAKGCRRQGRHCWCVSKDIHTHTCKQCIRSSCWCKRLPPPRPTLLVCFKRHTYIHANNVFAGAKREQLRDDKELSYIHKALARLRSRTRSKHNEKVATDILHHSRCLLSLSHGNIFMRILTPTHTLTCTIHASHQSSAHTQTLHCCLLSPQFTLSLPRLASCSVVFTIFNFMNAITMFLLYR